MDKIKIVIAAMRMSVTYWSGIGVVFGVAASTSLDSSCKVSRGGVHGISIELELDDLQKPVGDIGRYALVCELKKQFNFLTSQRSVLCSAFDTIFWLKNPRAYVWLKI